MKNMGFREALMHNPEPERLEFLRDFVSGVPGEDWRNNCIMVTGNLGLDHMLKVEVGMLSSPGIQRKTVYAKFFP